MKARSHRRGLATLVAVSLALAPSVALAAPAPLRDPAARAHFEAAQRHFDEADYAAAIPELKAAYALEPNPMLLYAWGQAERLAGSCSRAVELYRRFLATNPSADQRQLAEANLLDCEAELPNAPPPAATTESTDVVAPAPEPVAEEPTSLTDDAPRRPWYADPAGGALVGVGVPAMIAGGVLVGLGRRRAAEAPNLPVEQDHADASAEAKRQYGAGVVVLSVGGALVLGGAIRYAIVATRGRSSKATARWQLSPALGGIAVRGRF